MANTFALKYDFALDSDEDEPVQVPKAVFDSSDVLKWDEDTGAEFSHQVS